MFEYTVALLRTQIEYVIALHLYHMVRAVRKRNYIECESAEKSVKLGIRANPKGCCL